MQPCSMAASFHCLVVEWKDCEELKPKPKEQWIFVDQKREETKHRTEWFAETNKCRCMRCGRGNKYLRCQENAQGQKYLSTNLGNGEKRFGRTRSGKKNVQAGRSF